MSDKWNLVSEGLFPKMTRVIGEHQCSDAVWVTIFGEDGERIRAQAYYKSHGDKTCWKSAYEFMVFDPHDKIVAWQYITLPPDVYSGKI